MASLPSRRRGQPSGAKGNSMRPSPAHRATHAGMFLSSSMSRRTSRPCGPPRAAFALLLTRTGWTLSVTAAGLPVYNAGSAIFAKHRCPIRRTAGEGTGRQCGSGVAPFEWRQLRLATAGTFGQRLLNVPRADAVRGAVAVQFDQRPHQRRQRLGGAGPAARLRGIGRSRPASCRSRVSAASAGAARPATRPTLPPSAAPEAQSCNESTQRGRRGRPGHCRA